MRNRLSYLIIGAITIGFFFVGAATLGQRSGGGRAGAAGGARGGAVVGPYGGSAARSSRGGTVVGPDGGSASGGAQRGSYTTAGGSTVRYGGAGRTATGPGGASAGRAVGGVQVTGPGGQSATKVGRVGGVSGPGGNSAARRSSVGVASGPGGTAVGASRGGVATGPGGTVARGGRVGAAVGPGGTVTGASRGGVAVGPGGAVAGGARWGAAAGPYGLSRYAAGTVATRHGTRFVAAGTLPARGAYVRRGFVHYNSFTPTWYRAYPGAWRAATWTTAAAIWTGATWAALSRSCGYPLQPVIYDYGTTLVYEGDRVYYQGEPIASALEYSEQATEIASHGLEAKPPDTAEWVSLGVFAMVQGDEQDASDIFQLAINKDGIIRGNFYNALSDTTVPVYGSVDNKTQRAAWTVGEHKNRVFETGIANLTEPETSMLVHFGTDRTQQWTLVRLEQPEEEK
jgi:hypothetical protein